MFPDMNPAVVRRAPFPAQAHHKRCGKQRLRPRVIWLAMGAGLVAAMFGVATMSALTATAHPGDVAGSAALESQGTVEQPATGSPQARTAAGAKLTAADLWLEYARDPAGADRRFRDRPVVVSGMVRSIERDFDGRLMIRLSTGGGVDTVNAKLATRDDPAISLVGKGRALSLGCVGRGALIGAPLLGSCSVL